jgi:hypothetical protein
MSDSYPLTKISDTKFIEGYWRHTKKRPEPKPKKISPPKDKTNPDYDSDMDSGTDYSSDEESYPFPISSGTDVDINFIEKLDKIISMGNNCETKPGHLVRVYESKKIDKIRDIIIEPRYYKGYSVCRLCEKKNNGSSEYTITRDDVKYIFPRGILHYYESHQVQPSKEFYELIMDINLVSN